MKQEKNNMINNENINWLKTTLKKFKKQHCEKQNCSNCTKAFTQADGEKNCPVAIVECRIAEFKHLNI